MRAVRVSSEARGRMQQLLDRLRRWHQRHQRRARRRAAARSGGRDTARCRQGAEEDRQRAIADAQAYRDRHLCRRRRSRRRSSSPMRRSTRRRPVATRKGRPSASRRSRCLCAGTRGDARAPLHRYHGGHSVPRAQDRHRCQERQWQRDLSAARQAGREPSTRTAAAPASAAPANAGARPPAAPARPPVRAAARRSGRLAAASGWSADGRSPDRRAVLVVLAALLLSRSLFTVVEGADAHCARGFGDRVQGEYGPGLHVKWPLDQVLSLRSAGRSRMPFRPRAFLTRDQKLLSVDFYLQVALLRSAPLLP